MKINKKIAAGIMSVVAMAISVTGISASATSEYYAISADFLPMTATNFRKQSFVIFPIFLHPLLDL